MGSMLKGGGGGPKSQCLGKAPSPPRINTNGENRSTSKCLNYSRASVVRETYHTKQTDRQTNRRTGKNKEYAPNLIAKPTRSVGGPERATGDLAAKWRVRPPSADLHTGEWHCHTLITYNGGLQVRASFPYRTSFRYRTSRGAY
ncbi:hypothetical protein J6590_014086 [Homalodisca vitripennis]|nr:hypothetical protein J6590_014086 [Homalodisca vitripennis]